MRAGALGDLISVDILRSSLYPPYPGGALPPQYRTAGYPFRDLGIHGLYVIEAFLGPIETRGRHLAAGQRRRATWRSTTGARVAHCKQGMGQFQLAFGVRPLQHQIILQGTKGVMRLDLFLMFQASRKPAPLPKPAERIVNALTDSIQPLVDVPLNVIAFARKQMRQYHGVQELVIAFYDALSRGPPAAGDRRGRDQRREVDRGGGAGRRRRRRGAGRALPAHRRRCPIW